MMERIRKTDSIKNGGESGSEIGLEPVHDSSTGAPRWVKIFVTITIVMALLFILLHLIGRVGGHTLPMEHTVQEQ